MVNCVSRRECLCVRGVLCVLTVSVVMCELSSMESLNNTVVVSEL
jgi:hypothetical protein